MLGRGREFKTTLEFYSDQPSMPGDGAKLAWESAAKRALGTNQGGYWSVGHIRIEPTDTIGRYKLLLPLRKRTQRQMDLDDACKVADKLAERIESRLGGWKLKADSLSSDSIGDGDSVKDVSVQELLKFPDDIMGYFEHLYDRELQVRETLKSIEIHRDSNMNIRNHLLFYGPKGTGKTTIGEILTKIFGDIAVRRLDATSLTKAGAEKILFDTGIIPGIIIIEEGDKLTNESHFSWLLGVMDDRGIIMKNTAHKDMSRVVKSLVIMTVNDIGKFRSFLGGTIADRFSTQLYFPLLKEQEIRQILLREIKTIPNGNPKWVEAALRYGVDILRTYQVRRIRSIMCIGQDRLLTGEYQREHDAIRAREDQDNNKINQENLS